jgi:hypothetical protein
LDERQFVAALLQRNRERDCELEAIRIERNEIHPVSWAWQNPREDGRK